MAIHVPDDAEIEFEEEPVTYTAIHDWVPLTPGLSDAAVRYYHVLRMHVNRSRGDNQVKATTLTLARMMGRSRGDKTAPWLAELVAIGAVKVTRRGLPSRYVYKIEQEPPADWPGPVNIRQWYEVHREELTQARAAAKAKRDGRRAKKPQVEPSSPDVGVTEGQTPVPPMSGLQVAPTSGAQVTPTSGREPNDFEPNDFEPPPPPTPPGRPPVPDPRQAGEEGAVKQKKTPLPLSAGETALRAVLTAAPAHRRALGAARIAELARLIDARLADGWTVDQVVDITSDPLDGVDSVYGTVKWRIDTLLAGPPPPVPPPTPRPGVLQACSCVGGVVLVANPDDPVHDRVLPCPQCRPAEASAAA